MAERIYAYVCVFILIQYQRAHKYIDVIYCNHFIMLQNAISIYFSCGNFI